MKKISYCSNKDNYFNKKKSNIKKSKVVTNDYKNKSNT